MARPKRNGLLYFSLDADFFIADKRIRALITRFGCAGPALYLYILCEVYREEGYYLSWGVDAIDAAMDTLRLKEGLIKQIMTFLFSRSLLTEVSTLAVPDPVVTSPGIQKRYQEAQQRRNLGRDVPVIPDIWMLEEEETASFIKFTHKPDNLRGNGNKLGGNGDKLRGNALKERKGKEKESKEKETKEKETKGEQGAPDARHPGPAEAAADMAEGSLPPKVESAVREWVEFKKEKREEYKPIGLRNFLSLVEKKTKEYGEEAVVNQIKEAMSQNYKGVIWDKLAAKPGSSQGGIPPGRGNKFNNFNQRSYDMDELEKRLLEH